MTRVLIVHHDLDLAGQEADALRQFGYFDRFLTVGVAIDFALFWASLASKAEPSRSKQRP
jgi:hypothetical protein